VRARKTNKLLIVVGGPTASGKTSLGIQLAQHFGTEIISADSRQFYNELNVGVAKPSIEELSLVKHHFIGHISITDYFSAGEFERQTLALLDRLFKTNNVVVMVGGSGLFINAVLNGFHENIKDDGTVRKELEAGYETKGLDYLRDRLNKVDPEYVRKIDLSNPQRLIRAIEQSILSKKTYAERTVSELEKRPFKSIEIALDHPREVLYDRINTRVDGMMKNGHLEEVKSLVAHKHLNALQTVGYSELFACLEGEITLEQAIDKIKQNTRRYAKRQITWFKNKSNTTWFSPGDLDRVIDYVTDEMNKLVE